MPSPVSHSLIGLAIGMARFLPRVANWRQLARQIWACRVQLFICILLANAPDLDYLFGIQKGDLNFYHQSVTHTAVWVVGLAFIIWACGWPDRSWRSLLFVMALIASHLVADFFTHDRSKPYGMMLAWPFCDQYWISPISVFPAPEKRHLADLLSFRNFTVVIRELMITLSLVAVVAALKFRPQQAGEKACLDANRSINHPN